MPIDPSLPDDLAREALTADAVVAHASEGGHGHTPPRTHCLNCGTALTGHYCHKCGQHDFDFHQSFGHVFLEALENFLHFDTKLFRNIVTLLFRPGRLSADFNAGKRAAQMPPFRLYVFTAFVFFILMFASGSTHESAFVNDAEKSKSGDVHRTDDFTLTSLPERAIENTRAANAEAEKRAAEVAAKNPDTIKPKKVKKEEQSPFLLWLEERGHYAISHQAEFVTAILHAIPKMMLICLPFFALFTRVLFRKSGQVYLQHLVIALHIHTFFYLWVLCTKGWVGIAALPHWGLEGWVQFFCSLWLCLYPFVMLRNLFRNSWPKTIFKTCLLSIAYAMTLALVFFAVAMVYLVWL